MKWNVQVYWEGVSGNSRISYQSMIALNVDKTFFSGFTVNQHWRSANNIIQTYYYRHTQTQLSNGQLRPNASPTQKAKTKQLAKLIISQLRSSDIVFISEICGTYSFPPSIILKDYFFQIRITFTIKIILFSNFNEALVSSLIKAPTLVFWQDIIFYVQ